MSSIRDNLAAVRVRIESALERAGPGGAPRQEVRLVAVTKTQPPERIREAYEAGQRHFGENLVQEFEQDLGASELYVCWNMGDQSSIIRRASSASTDN